MIRAGVDEPSAFEQPEDDDLDHEVRARREGARGREDARDEPEADDASALESAELDDDQRVPWDDGDDFGEFDDDADVEYGEETDGFFGYGDAGGDEGFEDTEDGETEEAVEGTSGPGRRTRLPGRAGRFEVDGREGDAGDLARGLAASAGERRSAAGGPDESGSLLDALAQRGEGAEEVLPDDGEGEEERGEDHEDQAAGEKLPDGRGEADSLAAGDDSDTEPADLALEDLQSALEAVLFSTGEPVTIRQLAELFEVSVHDVREAVDALTDELEDTQRAFRVTEVAGGLQLLTLPRFHPWIVRMRRKRKDQRLSQAALETLAVIAYKQPISKATLEGIRGVQCAPILKTLLDRGLVKIVGREESLGKPLLYGTTPRFLESFGIASLNHLPQPELDHTPDPGEL